MSFNGTLSVTNYNRPWISDALDNDFIRYIEAKKISNSNIFHFGTGDHHLIGKFSGKNNNNVLAITASPEEFLTYIKMVKENKYISHSYQVSYGDIYNINYTFYNNFDILYLPHLCEYSMDSSNEYYKDFNLIKSMLIILKYDGKIILNRKSNHFNHAHYIINKLILDGNIDIEFDSIHENLIILKKNKSVNPTFSLINYNKAFFDMHFIKKNTIIDLLKSCRFYKSQMQYYTNNIYKNDIMKINNIPSQNEVNIMIVAHPDDEAIFGGYNLLTEKNWLVIYCTNDTKRIDMIKDISKKWEFNAIVLSNADSPIQQYKFDKEVFSFLHNIITQKKWNMLVTHNRVGEYNHIQHILIHKMITFILYNTIRSKRPNIIQYFTPCLQFDEVHKSKIIDSLHYCYKRQNWDNMIGKFKGDDINFSLEINKHNNFQYKLSEFLYDS